MERCRPADNFARGHASRTATDSYTAAAVMRALVSSDDSLNPWPARARRGNAGMGNAEVPESNEKKVEKRKVQERHVRGLRVLSSTSRTRKTCAPQECSPRQGAHPGAPP